MVLLFHGGMRASKRAGREVALSNARADRASRRPVPRSTGRVRRDEQQAKVSRLAVVLSLFLVLLAAAALVGGRAVIDPMLGAAAEAREANRVGDIVFTMPDGAVCRHLSFDNTTAEISESSAARCPEARPRGGEPARSAKGFAWGAQ